MKTGVWKKDMRIIGDMARAVRAATPLFDACGPIFDAALAAGYADADTAAGSEVLRNLDERAATLAITAATMRSQRGPAKPNASSNAASISLASASRTRPFARK